MNKTTLLNCQQLLDIFSSSHIATAIYTTEDLIIEAVTDAMLGFWGKDRSIIGLPLEEAVPELKGQSFKQMLQNVLKTGVTDAGVIAAETIVDGQLKEAYYEYEYRPIKNEAGEVYCILHTASDVTNHVLGKEAIEQEEQQREELHREQSLNEELATANEELSAINEELEQTQESLHQLNNELEERVGRRTRKLAESEANLRYIIDDAPVAICVLAGPEHLIESANRNMLQIWGKTSSVIGQPLQTAIPELIEQGFITHLNTVFTSSKPLHFNEAKTVFTHEGKLHNGYYNLVFQPVTNDTSTSVSIIVVATEVTDQVRSRQSVEESKYRLQAMVNTTPAAMTILHSRDLVIEQANMPMLNIWRRQSEDVIGKRLIDAFPELKDQPFPELMAQVFETGERLARPEIEVNLSMPDGSFEKHYSNFSYDPLFDQQGKVESILVTVIDITEAVTSRLQLETSKAELQEITEELAATNEELTSVNEEMTASNEELLSTNEELVEVQEQLKNTILQLKDSQDRFKFLLNAMPQQVWTATADGALNYINEKACQDLGYTPDDTIGHGWQKFIHPDDLSNALKRWSLALQAGHEYAVEFRLLFKDGVYHWHLARAIPLIENGKITLWLGTNTNIDLQKTNEQKKDEFLSIASHELKTPLTSIKAFNQLMKRARDAEKINGFIHKSSDHIYRLEKLITDLLDVTKLNAGKLEYNMQPFSFKQLLTESIESVQHMSPTHQIILESSADIQFTGDYFRLEQVINNFLTNAVKYSPQGQKVLINSKLDNDSLTVSVQDFGIGIPKAHIEKLFDRYYRVDNTSMRFEGLGLGLFISSEILKRHQGKFWIESEPGQGSTFYFSLPVLKEEHITHKGVNIDLNQNLIAN